MTRRSLALLLLFFLALPLAAANDAELYKAGRNALAKGELDKAVSLFEKAVAAKPNSSEYHFWLGSAYGSQAMKASMVKQAGLAKKVKAEFEKAVELDPNNIEARFGLIDYYLRAPDFMGGSEEKALQQAAEVKKRESLAGHRAYARVYMRQKKTDLARKELVEAVREQPNSAKAHAFLGNFLLNEKNFAGARHEYEMAIKLDPSYMPAWFRLGQTIAQSGPDHPRGEEALKKYLAYKPTHDEPQHVGAWYWLGQLYEKQGKKEAARSAYLNALRLAPAEKDIQAAVKRLS
jgi:tetratricopeptide (TPR) repeat protein